MLPPNIQTFYNSLIEFIPQDRLISDIAGTFAYGTDASFYRLTPQLVAKVETEAEVARLLELANSQKIPLTFRAAGTSLCGQSASNSVLVLLGNGSYHPTLPPLINEVKIKDRQGCRVLDNGKRVYLEPTITGGRANKLLAPYGRRLGPDPASINSATIGGITANNSGGMCCGAFHTSYHTIDSMRIVFAGGAVLDLSDEASKMEFAKIHKDVLDKIQTLSKEAKANTALAEKIRRKYKIKNTTGYSLNALIDFDDPFDIILHLIVGSEGTLGFISSVIYNTVHDYKLNAASLLLFPDIENACLAVQKMVSTPAHAVEMLDRASLRAVEDFDNVPSMLKELPDGAAGLLVETRTDSPDALNENIKNITDSINSMSVLYPIQFFTDTKNCETLWNMRKGLFPAVGAMREARTTIMIEDIAVPINDLAKATLDLQALFKKHGYDQTIILGHALAGNLHFLFPQNFEDEKEVKRYENFMDDLCQMVVNKYDGSLKSEHGTGVNMAPFVEFEWGEEAYDLMKRIKDIFDPNSILNPGVILNNDRSIHLKNLKPFPVTNEVIDKCIECGYCEINCASRNLTLTPRQRIALWREITMLRQSNDDNARLAALEKSFKYYGEETCAADGLCATSCPVKIDTGVLVKNIRNSGISDFRHKAASLIGANFHSATMAARLMLGTADLIHSVFGARLMKSATNLARSISGNIIPRWNSEFPRPASMIAPPTSNNRHGDKVVYYPSCLARIMGPAKSAKQELGTPDTVMSTLTKAGYEIVLPGNLEELCCGKAFESKGYFKAAENKSKQLEAALLEASNNGEYPILCETSPCWLFMTENFKPGLKLYEPIGFIKEYIINRITLKKLNKKVAVHPTCSARKMGLAESLVEVASLCADEVVCIDEIGCCGFAGDKGFFRPELNESALADLKSLLPKDCSEGYSTSRACEIGLSEHGEIPYQSIFHLVDEAADA